MANNHLEQVLAREGAEVVMPELANFMLYMDGDAGASEVSQMNRLKLMLSLTKEKCPEGMHMAEAAETAAGMA